ncbi:methylosome protein WDR77 [Hyperolius riggenbachi]|uniref:methylosome protein WDR77 n=1 Tax=Hyperolius riggenbachi TaxID=752182 RepID=UPI0035A27341
MSAGSPWGSPMRAPACMEVHLGAVRYRRDGAMLLAASSLNSRTWGGSIWVFKDPLGAPDESLCTAGVQTEAGVADVAWVLEKGILVASDTAHSSYVNSVAACPGKENVFLSCSEDGRVLLWDTRNPKPAKRIDFCAPHGVPTYVTWHPDKDDTFACGDETGNVYIVNINNPGSAQILAVHSRPVTGLAYSNHSSPFLASVSEDCTVVVLNSESTEIFRNDSHHDFVTGVAWSPLNPSVFTTVGWDHKVLHHSLPKENSPESQDEAQA